MPTAKSVLGFDLGQREVTTAESDRYLRAIDAASPLVAGSVLGTSHQGRPLSYAVVGTPARVAAAKAAATTLRDPATSPAQARATAASAPAILWVAGNVHGGEESGTDASLRVLYELAARTDCAAAQIRDNAVVAILPTQNPDGRELDTRRNAYGFDMNRDWFARTQPETDGKLEALRQYPPVLFIDAHEMGSKDYFFPPNADPIYHEITDESVSWINDTYGAAMQQEFDRQKIPYFNYAVYDMFYMGYGDTVPTTGFLGAGMTFEKSSYDGIGKRLYEQYVAIWTSLSAAATSKASILEGWAASFREALRQGTAGELEENEVVQPENTVQNEVPDLTIRHYFLRADDPAKSAEVQALVRRLQRMDVQVRRLTAPLVVPDYTPYAGSPASTTLPVGTYWVPMAQAQKHWVQAMLNEDTYTPFPYFYDVTAWSQPLLFNVAGGRSGAELAPSSQVVPALRRRPSRRCPPTRPRWRSGRCRPAPEPSSRAAGCAGCWTRSGSCRTTTSPRPTSPPARWPAPTSWWSPTVTPPRERRRWARRASRCCGTGSPPAAGWSGSARALSWPGGSASPAQPSPRRPRTSRARWCAPRSGPGRWPPGWAAPCGTSSSTTRCCAPPTRPAWPSPTSRPRSRCPGSPRVRTSWWARPRSPMSGTAPAGSCCSPRTRTSGPSPTAPRRSCGTRCSGPIPATLRAGSTADRTAATAAAQGVPDLGGDLLVTVRPGSAGQARQLLTANGLSASTTSVGGNVRLRVAGFGSADENPVSRALVRELTRLGAGVVAVRLP